MRGEKKEEGMRKRDRSGLGIAYSWIDNCIGAKGSVN